MILEILTTVAGVLMSLGHFPQAYEIWKKKSAASVSVLTFATFALGTTLWLFYGVYTKNLVISISFAPGVIGSWTVLILTLYYNKLNSKNSRN